MACSSRPALSCSPPRSYSSVATGSAALIAPPLIDVQVRTAPPSAEHPRQPELGEDAGTREPRQHRDPAALQGQDEDRERATGVGGGPGEVAAERRLPVGTGRHEPQRCTAAFGRTTQE